MLTPDDFVAELKKDVRRGVAGIIYYLLEAPGGEPPAHLAALSDWYIGLSEESRERAREAMEFAAQGSLFSILNYLDNVRPLPSGGDGEFELYYVENDTRVRLNDPAGHYLHELFNNIT